ncbi:MAG TPA: hypothetical protein VN153_08795 [Tahibacter sp.]|nr:hypothetical protein [Tahibacter sp.]
MRLPPLAIMLCLALLSSAPAWAKDKDPSTRFVDVAKQEQFADQADAIRQEMKAGGRFEYVNAAERRQVEEQLDAIAAVLRKRAGAKLDDDDQLEIYAAQETANAILTQRDGRRMICEYSAPTGSNRKVKQCVTYADRMRAHAESRNYMRENFGKSPPASEGDRAFTGGN